MHCHFRKIASSDIRILKKGCFTFKLSQTYIMETPKTSIDELSEKVLFGMKIAIRKLVEAAARENATLVIGDEDGNIKHVPAKNLLNSVENYPKNLTAVKYRRKNG